MRTFIALSIFASLVSAFDFTVGVGKDETTGKKGLGFDPSVIHPQAGDHIVFEFRSGDHSAVQSTFENPCSPLEGGFNSGVINVPDSTPVDAPGLPQISLLVNGTDPLWFFDQAGGQCNQGALLSVNPTSTQTPAQFKENASRAPVSPPPSATSGNGNGGDASSTSSGSDSGSATSDGAQSTPTNSATTTSTTTTMSVLAVFFGVVVGLL